MTYFTQNRSLVIKDFTLGEDKIEMIGKHITGIYTGSFQSAREDELQVYYDAANDHTIIRSTYTWYSKRVGIRLEGDFVNNADPALNLSASDFIFDYVDDNSAGDSDATANVLVDNDSSRNGLVGSTSDDTIISSTGNEEIAGLEGNDLIIARSIGGRAEIRGGRGDDVILAGTQNVVVNAQGAPGNDTLVAGTGGDFTYYGSNGADLFIDNAGGGGVNRTGNGNDSLYGGRGDDNYLESGGGNDYLNAGEGDDDHRTAGGGGNDTIIGGYGQDILWGGNWNNYGGSGNDVFVFYDPLESESASADRILDFNEGNDVIEVHGFTGIGAGMTELSITLYNATQFGFPGQNWTDIESNDPDIDFKITIKEHITFTDGVNLVFNSGELGTSAADTLDYSLNLTDTFAFGLQGSDTITGGSGNDSLFGGHDGDDISGGAGDDSLSGGYANDTLTGGAGTDTLEGGSGVDTFVFTASDSTAANTDVIWDFRDGNDADLIDLSDASFGGISYVDLTIEDPSTIGGYMTKISHTGSGFEVYLVGYYEDGLNIDADDFIF